MIPRRGSRWWIFKKEKFELLALTETKLKEKEEVSWSGVNVIFAQCSGKIWVC